ncbi:hypothetical protein D9619_006451 [Psilocybe cf. subviscida]|uniref:Uncharacterized protein n=1 Tax=Psilocybe cf. subviscida TaxID=2480587 RepID=A0A8H5B3Y9_9AGAR|nr:hypothetical protein D9619_006451 [Psilocybe cf. subviscida]
MASTSDTTPHPARPKAASRLIHSVKRTLSGSSSSMPSSRKRYPTPPSKSGMRSTLAESGPVPLQQQHQFREPDPHSSRPTIEQIAMGLHVSRTPHLRPHAASPYGISQVSASGQFSHTGHRLTPIALPPPPARSSMKKTGVAGTLTSSSSSPAVSPPLFSSASSGSTTTVTSVTPSRGSAQPRAFAAIKFHMSRFLPHSNNSRSSSAPSSLLSSPDDSPRTSASDYPPQHTRKKAVRFNTGTGTDTADRAGDGD